MKLLALYCLLFFAVCGTGLAQNIYLAKAVELSFFSKARFENIEAVSSNLALRSPEHFPWAGKAPL
jgi:hypothetical protein